MKIHRLVLAILIFFTACISRPTPLALPTETAPLTTPTPNEVQPVSATPGETLNPIPENPYAPKTNDEKLYRANVLIEEYGVLTMESYPPQFSVSFSGSLPDPCHELRAVIDPPNAENKILIEVYSVVDPNLICTQVIKPFAATLPLGSFPKGHYQVWLNDILAGEFDS